MVSPTGIHSIPGKIFTDEQAEIIRGIATTSENISLHHAEMTSELVYRCGVLEAIQIRLFSVLAETNPSEHRQVVEELKKHLDYIESEGGENTSFAAHIRSLAGSKPGKKVHLKLVPKKSPPDSS